MKTKDSEINAVSVPSIEFGLEALSPVSFMRVRKGEVLRIRMKAANKREYRDKIGSAADCLLVFKDETKIGMIPHKVLEANEFIRNARVCRVSEVQEQTGTLLVKVTALLTTQTKIS